MNSPHTARTPGRNDPCPCGSGKKYKHCHGAIANVTSGNPAVPGPAPGIEQRFAQAYHLFQTGALPQAKKICTEILSRKPGHVHANHLLGLCCYQEGDYGRAQSCLKRAVRLDPTDPDAQSNLAMVLGRRGQLADAEEHARKAVELNPQSPGALSILGKILVDARNLSEAGLVLEQALALNDGNPDALSAHGDLMLAQRRLPDARVAYERALSLMPDSVQTLNDLGLVLLELKEFESAQRCFHRAAMLAPRDAEIEVNLGRVASAKGQLDTAHAHYLAALKLNNRFALAYTSLSVLALRKGNVGDSIEWLRRGVSACPNDAMLHEQLAVRFASQQEFPLAYEQVEAVARIAGDSAFTERARAEVYSLHRKTEEAAAAFERALELDPYNPELLMAVSDFEERRNRYDAAAEFAARAVALDPSREFLARVLAARAARRRREYDLAETEFARVDIASQPMSEQADAWYELGNLRDVQGQYPAAFDAYIRGARAATTSAGLSFDLEATLRGFEHTREVLSPETLKHLLQFSGEDEGKSTPIFIVGFMRSGTTLTEQILSCHPAVQAGDELAAVLRMSNNAAERLGVPQPDCLPLVSGTAGRAELAKLRAEYYTSVANTGLDLDREGFFTDKLPLNLLEVPLISMVFPEAPIIHIRRNPMDCVFSNFVSNFGSFSPWAYDLEVAATYYKGVMELGDYFRENLSMRYHELRYEDLVADPEPQIREIAEFAGLPWDDSMLRFYENKRVARTPSYAQVNQPMYTRSVERYRHYEEFLAKPLEILEPLMRRYGYLEGQN